MRSALLLSTVVLALASCAPAKEERIRDVIYQKRDGFALTMDVFKPAQPNGIGIVYVVSGGWFSNHNNIDPNMAKVFTDRGMTVFQVVHGSQPKFQVPEIANDIHRAVRFIRANASTYGVDPNRLGITGASAGGHLSLTIATQGGPGRADAPDPVDRQSSAVQAAGVFFPPTDMLNWRRAGDFALDIPTLRVFWPAFGITAQTPRERIQEDARRLSPIYFVTERTPPVLLISGDADLLVPVFQTQTFAAKLKESKVPHEVVIVPGKGHGWQGMEVQVAQIADWFAKRLAK